MKGIVIVRLSSELIDMYRQKKQQKNGENVQQLEMPVIEVYSEQQYKNENI